MDILPSGFYLARRLGPGNWEHELVVLEDASVWLDFFEKWDWVNLDWAEFFWQENGQPGVVMHTYPTSGFDGRLYIALRQPAGQWEMSCVYAGQLPLNYSKRGIYSLEIEHTGAERFVVLADEFIETTSSQSVFHSYILRYDHGELTVEDTGAEYTGPVPASTHWMLADLAVDSQGDIVCLLDKSFQTYPNELWILRRLGPDSWIDERIDSGDLEPATGTYLFEQCYYDENDRLLISSYVYNLSAPDFVSERRLYQYNNGSFSLAGESEIKEGYLSHRLFRTGTGSQCAFFEYYYGGIVYHFRFEEDIVLEERISNLAVSPSAYYAGLDLKAYSEVEYDSLEGIGIDYVHEFLYRVDPRQ